MIVIQNCYKQMVNSIANYRAANNLAIDDKDLFHANAAVIAGIVVLFTFTTLVGKDQEISYKALIAATIAAFAGSSMMLIAQTIATKTLPAKKSRLSRINNKVVGNPRFWTSIGFVLLLVTILFLRYSDASIPNQPAPQPIVDLQRAINIAENLNETKDYRTNVAGNDIQITAVYLTAEQTEVYRQTQGKTSVPVGKPTILVTYFVKLDVENSTVLRVFVDPETYAVYGWFRYATQFG